MQKTAGSEECFWRSSVKKTRQQAGRKRSQAEWRATLFAENRIRAINKRKNALREEPSRDNSDADGLQENPRDAGKADKTQKLFQRLYDIRVLRDEM